MSRTLSSGNNLSYAGAVLTAAPLTMVCWVKPSGFAANQSVMVIDNNSSTNRIGLQIAITTGLLQAFITASGASSIALSTVGLTAGAWNHVGGVFAGANDRRAFVSGGNKGTNATSGTPSGLNRTYIGRQTTAANPLGGDACEAAIMNIAATDAEMALAATGVSPYAIWGSAVAAYWPILGLTSPEPDVVGAFPMTLAGTPPQAAHPFMFYGKNRFRRRGLLAA